MNIQFADYLTFKWGFIAGGVTAIITIIIAGLLLAWKYKEKDEK